MAGSAYKKVKTQNIDEEAATQHLLDVAATPHFLPLQTPKEGEEPPATNLDKSAASNSDSTERSINRFTTLLIPAIKDKPQLEALAREVKELQVLVREVKERQAWTARVRETSKATRNCCHFQTSVDSLLGFYFTRHPEIAVVVVLLSVATFKLSWKWIVPAVLIGTLGCMRSDLRRQSEARRARSGDGTATVLSEV